MWQISDLFKSSKRDRVKKHNRVFRFSHYIGDFDMTAQVISQLWGVGTVVVWSAVVSLVAYKLVDIVIGLRVPEEEEREGLDLTSHGESAYHH